MLAEELPELLGLDVGGVLDRESAPLGDNVGSSVRASNPGKARALSMSVTRLTRAT